VLLNGKRQHTTALVNVNSTVGRGSVGYDLNTIPAAAIERIEVLRDGAAAQYGSDAIAGIVNVVLKQRSAGGEARVQYGITREGDGETVTGSVTGGFALRGTGFLTATLAVTERGATDRSGVYNNTVYLAPLPQTRFPGEAFSLPLTAAEAARQAQDDAQVAARGFDRSAMVVGNSSVRSYQGFATWGLPVRQELELYGFAGFTARDGRAAGFYRYPNNARTSNLTLFPDGYLPFIETAILDGTIAAGVRSTGTSGWWFDVSSKAGGNSIGFVVDNSINASNPNSRQTRFDAGRLEFSQWTTNLDLSRAYDGFAGWQSLNVALGAEVRFDRYRIIAGEEASWRDYNPPGTPAAQVKASGVQVFGGFQPSNTADETRHSLGAYLDLEADISDRLLVAAAVRAEEYSDFGSNVSGKITGRYRINDVIAVRGGLDRGFRAPSLHQRFYSAVSTQFITVAGVNQQREVTTVRNDSLIARRLGIPSLTAETSRVASGGVTVDLGRRLTLTLDAYQIDISDRIVISGRFSNTVPQLAAFFAGTSITEAQFFTNAIDTRTRGLDLVANTSHRFASGLDLSATLAANFNKTEIRGGAAGVRTPAPLAGLGETLLNREERGRIEVNQPRDKYVLTLTLAQGRHALRAQITRFGEISTIAPQLAEQDQTFAPKVVTDASYRFAMTDRVDLLVGANNLFDIYPDRVRDPRLTNDGTVIYSRFATQFGFNGASWYVGLTARF
jgi:iron complex outermembrane receptor protein